MILFFNMIRVFLVLIFWIPFSLVESACSKSATIRADKCFLSKRVKPLVVIDPGHGGADFGARVQYVAEKRLTLSTALLLRKCLDTLGYRVVLTRSRDVFIPLQQRVLLANKIKAAAFISIHFNSAPGYPQANGIEVYYYKLGGDKGRVMGSFQLADFVLKEVSEQTKALSRGVKHGNFCVIRETLIPAILVEGGFLTNSGERGLLRDKHYLEKIAKGVALGVDKYLRSLK
jgi:N-acetylmuramoyl-L-alanine amidase